FLNSGSTSGRPPRAGEIYQRRSKVSGLRSKVSGPGARVRMNLKGGKPEKFGRVRSFFYEKIPESLFEPGHRRIASEIPVAKGRMLDVGCGPGALDRMIAAARPELLVVGLDESEAMIRRALQAPRPANLKFRAGAVEKATFGEEFDFALSVQSFHHWEEPEAGLEAVCRALKPGGRFWIYEGSPEAPGED